MHSLTCYVGQISLCLSKIEKYPKKNFVMNDKDGGDNFWILWRDTAVMRGDIELMEAPLQSPHWGKPCKLPIEIMISHYEWLHVGYKQKFTVVSHRDKNLILSS